MTISEKQASRGIMSYPAEAVADPGAAWLRTPEAPPKAAILYIHIPFCRSRCSFCPFYYGSASPAERADYVKLLIRELETWEKTFEGTTINTVYFGGGTPSDLEPDEIRRLLIALRSRYRLANDCEITLESRIDGLSPGKIDAALEFGVNRFSLGVQTFDSALRRGMGRVSDRETVLRTLNELTGRNQASVTADLLYGLPGETPEMLLNDLETMLNETGLSGFSFYRLHLHDRLQLAAQIREGRMAAPPDDARCFELFRLAEARMRAAGARRISFKHFAFHPRERNLHNEISAWKVPCIPFGIHAGGRLGPFRFKQTGDPAAYRRMVEAGEKPLASAGRLPEDYAVGSRIAGQMNCRMGLDVNFTLAAAPERLRERMREELMRQMSELVREELAEDTGFGGYLLTARGRFCCDRLAGRLMDAAAKIWNEVQ